MPLIEPLERRYFFCAQHQPDPAQLTPENCTLEDLHSGELAQHIHAQLDIIINGVAHTVPDHIGISAAGFAGPLHTHDDSGRIHVESFDPRPYTLGEFFNVWGQSLSANRLLNYTLPPGQTVQMSVNGRPIDAYGGWHLHDEDHIVLRADNATQNLLPSAPLSPDPGGAPNPAIELYADWFSLAPQTPGPDHPLPLPSGSANTEPRSAGVHKLQLEFSAPLDPASVSPASVLFSGTAVSSGALLDLSAYSVSTALSQDDSVLTLTFSNPLPSQARYFIELQGILSDTGAPLAYQDTRREVIAAPADISNDAKVDSIDFTHLLAGYGQSASAPPLGYRSDFNGDGKINTIDFNDLAGQFGGDLSDLPLLCGPGAQRGKVSVFRDGVIDWNTLQYKPTVDACIGNLGVYDSNGNLIGSNNGLLDGKWGKTEIISFDEQPGVGPPFDTLPHVNEIMSLSNDFRVDYTGATQSDPRAGLLQGAQGHFYYWIDDYRKRFLNDEFIDSLNMPAQLAQNLKHLQFRPDLQGATRSEKPIFEILENQSAGPLLYDPLANTYQGARTRTRANVLNYASLPPLSLGFDGSVVVGDYVGLATNWMVGFNALWTADFNNWQNNILAALSDGFSDWTGYR